MPQEAVGYDQRGAYVLVVNEKNLVQRLGIRTGAQMDPFLVVEEGLTGKEWIVIKGVQKSIPGRPVTPEKQNAGPPAPTSPQTLPLKKGGP